MKAIALFIALTGVLVAATNCSEYTGCPSSLLLKATLPETTTIRVGTATTATAGETRLGCEQDSPPVPDFTWKTSDSSVVSVTMLDSIHGRILALRPGSALVTPVYRRDPTQPTPPPVIVTVVP